MIRAAIGMFLFITLAFLLAFPWWYLLNRVTGVYY